MNKKEDLSSDSHAPQAMAGNLAANGWLQELSLANCIISDNGAAGS